MDHTFFSALILLLLVLDPLGSLPVFIPIMRGVPRERRTRVAIREVTIAFGVLVAFTYFGESFLRVMHLSERSLEVAGGVILLMVAIRMIFGGARAATALPLPRSSRYATAAATAVSLTRERSATTAALEQRNGRNVSTAQQPQRCRRPSAWRGKGR